MDDCDGNYTQSLLPPLPSSPSAAPSPPDPEVLLESVEALIVDPTQTAAGLLDGYPPITPPPPPSEASPNVGDVHPELGEGSEQPPHEEAHVTTPVFLADVLRERIVKQVEYYFSDENLPTDTFLLNLIKKNKEGFVPIAEIASFRKMKKLLQDIPVIAMALRTSSRLVVSSDGEKVKRLYPLSCNLDVDDAKLRTVLVKNIPENCSKDYIRKIFGRIGNVKRISIQGHSQKEASGIKKKTSFISKLHAYVEYETAEEADNAVTGLNDESNWRTGLRVEHVVKRLHKHVQKGLKGRKGVSAEYHDENNAPNTNGEESDMMPSDQPIETGAQEEKQVSQENESKIPSRRRGKVKQQFHIEGQGFAKQQFHIEGQGRRTVLSGPKTEGLNRPDSGPRMPDGTRGFTMGRGKPIVPIQND